jgi:hypothetical protein
MLFKADNLGLNRARTDDGQPDELSRPVCHGVIDAVLGAIFSSSKKLVAGEGIEPSAQRLMRPRDLPTGFPRQKNELCLDQTN